MGGNTPPRHAGDFASVAARLAGHASLAFGWTPDAFWSATPADVAALFAAAAPDSPDALATSDLARLMEAFPDG